MKTKASNVKRGGGSLKRVVRHPATWRQILYMQERAIYHAPNVTKAEATELITAYQASSLPDDERHIMDLED